MIKFHIQKDFSSRNLQVYAWDEHPAPYSGKKPISVASPIVFVEADSSTFSKPLFSVDMCASPNPLQGLMDELWDAGLRPTAGHGSAGQMAATENHLKDFRKLVAKLMGVEL